jgi:hypothetical protein
MYSKLIPIAMCVLAASACSSMLPWHDEPVGEEVNVAFTLQNNLIFLSSSTIDGIPGRYILGSAAPHTVVDPKIAHADARGRHMLELNDRQALRFEPLVADLHGVADAIVGADVWGTHAVTIDFRSGLVTYQREGIHPELMTTYSFSAEPMVNVTIDGRTISAVVDTSSPDTVILPRADAAHARGVAHVALAGVDFGNIDVRYADVALPRIGNRILSKFLLSIDYGKREVGLWRDPRIPM